jgi:hypothetical protein
VFVRGKDREREEARRLRRELGWSLALIARELGVAKSSVSVWVRGLGPGAPAGAGVPRPRDARPVRRVPIWRSGRVRRCGRCGHLLPLELFNRRGDGHQWWCRTCFAAYFRARGDLHRRQSASAKATRQQALRAHVLEHLTRHPCVDCGEHDAVVLEFDHLDEKSASISELVSCAATLGSLDAEIGRCEVVCANCHRRRTARRAGWRRAAPAGEETRPIVDRRIARNVAHVHAILWSSRCVDCGERDAVVLEFDHRGPKRGSVTQMAWWGFSVASIDAEIAQCEVRCANCHRRATARRGGHFRSRVLSSAVPP